jgi:hypothetical protein
VFTVSLSTGPNDSPRSAALISTINPAAGRPSSRTIVPLTRPSYLTLKSLTAQARASRISISDRRDFVLYGAGGIA